MTLTKQMAPISSPKARDAAIKTFEYWSKITTIEEAFDHAIAEYLIACGIVSGALSKQEGAE